MAYVAHLELYLIAMFRLSNLHILQYTHTFEPEFLYRERSPKDLGKSILGHYIRTTHINIMFSRVKAWWKHHIRSKNSNTTSRKPQINECPQCGCPPPTYQEIQSDRISQTKLEAKLKQPVQTPIEVLELRRRIDKKNKKHTDQLYGPPFVAHLQEPGQQFDSFQSLGIALIKQVDENVGIRCKSKYHHCCPRPESAQVPKPKPTTPRQNRRSGIKYNKASEQWRNMYI